MSIRFVPITAKSAAQTVAEPELRARWLVRVRNAGSVVQIALVLTGVFGLGLPPTWPLLALLIAIGVASNMAFVRVIRRRAPPESLFAAVLVLDVVILACLLAGTGGATNPFSVFFLVYVALATVVLTGRRAIALAVRTMIAFATLFLRGSAEKEMLRLHHGAAFSIHLYGMWFAYVVAAAIVATFIARLVRALRERDHELTAANDARARAERVAALGALAAGAAHELATPLGTRAILANDLERGATTPDRVCEDGRTLRAEVERCRAIVDDLAGRSGSDVGEAPRAVQVSDVLAQVRAALGDVGEGVGYRAPDSLAIQAPVKPLVRALVNLVRNAIDAGGAIEIVGELHGDAVRFSVRDEGPGLDAAVLEHLGEPFMTTKSAGRGMGLGVYLVRAFADASGGTLSVATSKTGSTFVLELPAEVR
ncbi:ATP-binding protein [soil metagenome]